MQEIGMDTIPTVSGNPELSHQPPLTSPPQNPNRCLQPRKSVLYSKCCLCLKIRLILLLLALILFGIKVAIDSYSSNFSNQSDTLSYPTTVYSPIWRYLEPDFACTSDKCLNAAQEILNGLDTSVDPCDNFYDFACNGWLKRNIIPPYMFKWSAFEQLDLKMDKLTIQILNQSKSSSEPQSIQMAKDHYEACMKSRIYDDARRQNESLQFIWDKLEEYGGWPILYKNGTWDSSRFSWMTSVIGMKREFDFTQLIDVTISQRFDGNVSANSVIIRPPSSDGSSVESLPDEQDSEPETTKTNSVYKMFIVNITKELLTFKKREINETHISAIADQIIFVELLLKDLTTGSDKVESYTVQSLQTYLDAHRLYDDNAAISVQGLLNRYFAKAQIWISEFQPLTVRSPDYLNRLSDTILWLEPETLANYLHFKLLFNMIPLSNVKTLHEFLNTVSMHSLGKSMPVPNEQRCVEKVEQNFPMALGFAFLEKIGYSKYDSQSNSYGSANNFTNLEKMFTNIKVEYEKLLVESSPPYMDVNLIRYKLAITELCAGYPSWIFSTERLESVYADLILAFNNSTNALDYMGQSIAINTIKFVKQLKNLRKARDSDPCQWQRFPGTVGAFSRIFSVYVPVAMLQEPFYDEDLPKFLNFGKIGTILGHEITHGLYGLGWSEYENGSLTSPATCLVNQYERFYNPAANLTLNGVLTLEENFCDNAGLAAAFRAYRRSSVSDAPHNFKGLENYTNDQLFFLGFAQNFCEKSTWGGLTSSLETDVHSPGPVRVIEALKNSDDFAQTWRCPKGSTMNPGLYSGDTCVIFDTVNSLAFRSTYMSPIS